MCMLKEQSKDTKSKPVIDIETMFLRYVLFGQQGKKELCPLLAYELCAVQPALIDGQRCFCKGN